MPKRYKQAEATNLLTLIAVKVFKQEIWANAHEMRKSL